MRDYTGRELAKVSDIKEGDTIDVRAGAMPGLEPGTHTVRSSPWGLHVTSDRYTFYFEDWPREYDGEAYFLSGAYPVIKENPVNTTSPLSEDEMRAFFERMVTSFVGYSKQAEELKQVQSNLAELNEKFSRQSEAYIRLEATNQNLQNQVYQLDEVIRGKNKQLEDITAERDLYVEQNSNLHNEVEIVNRQLAETGRQLAETHNTLEQKDTIIQGLEVDISEKNEQIKLIMADRDNASSLYSETRDKLEEAERKLRVIQDLFRSTQEAMANNVVNF